MEHLKIYTVPELWQMFRFYRRARLGHARAMLGSVVAELRRRR